jgi:hypothetical protein
VNKSGPNIPVTVRVPVGGEVADESLLPAWDAIAPCDDRPAPAGRQQQHLFQKENFDD